MALINYHGKNLLTVNYAVPNPHNLETRSVVFMPGLNEISEEDVKAIESNLCVQARFQNGTLEKLGSGELEPEGKTVVEMLSLIPKIVNSKLLKKIIETDEREPVLKAAKARLDVVQGTPKTDGVKANAARR